MNKLTQDQQEHDEILALLPWHLNHSLSVDESGRVRRHLQQCITCQQEAGLLDSALAAANRYAPATIDAEDIEGLKKSEDNSFDNLMTRIDAAEAANTSSLLKSSRSNLWQSLQSIFTFNWQAGAAVMASLVVVGVSIYFARSIISPSPAAYEVLSTTPSVNDSPLSLRVRFNSSTAIDEVEALLNSKAVQAQSNIAFTLQREDATDYIVSVSKDMSLVDLNALLAALNAEEEILSVEVALTTAKRTN